MPCTIFPAMSSSNVTETQHTASTAWPAQALVFGALRCSRLDSLLVYHALGLCMPQVLRLLQDPSDAAELQVCLHARMPWLQHDAQQRWQPPLLMQRAVQDQATLVRTLHRPAHAAPASDLPPWELGNSDSRRAIVRTFAVAVGLSQANSVEALAEAAQLSGIDMAVKLKKGKHKHKHSRKRSRDNFEELDTETPRFRATLTAGHARLSLEDSRLPDLRQAVAALFLAYNACTPVPQTAPTH